MSILGDLPYARLPKSGLARVRDKIMLLNPGPIL